MVGVWKTAAGAAALFISIEVRLVCVSQSISVVSKSGRSVLSGKSVIPV